MVSTFVLFPLSFLFTIIFFSSKKKIISRNFVRPLNEAPTNLDTNYAVRQFFQPFPFFFSFSKYIISNPPKNVHEFSKTFGGWTSPPPSAAFLIESYCKNWAICRSPISALYITSFGSCRKSPNFEFLLSCFFSTFRIKRTRPPPPPPLRLQKLFRRALYFYLAKV